MDRRGLWLVSALALTNAAAAILLDHGKFAVGFGWSGLRLVLLSVFLPALGWVLWQPIRLALAHHQHPIRELSSVFVTQSPRLANVIIVMGLFLINANSVGVFKSSIPNIMPFYADPLFTSLDRMIFGTDPWRITHSLMPGTTFFFDRLYVTWFIGLYGSIVVLAFSTDAKKQFTGLLAFTLIWIVLGQICATLMSSVGPILVGGVLGDSYFDPLLSELRRAPGLFALMTAERLMSMDSGIGAGISAMPSLHVAMAVFWVLLTRLYCPRLTIFAAIYALLIWIASFHLGWHYALDGIVSLIGVLLIWRIVHWAANLVFIESAPVWSSRPAHH